MQEALEWTATQMARKLARREVSALELVNFYLQRIEKIDSRINAFTHVATRQAKLSALAWDIANGFGRRPKGPLSGVPIAIKDLSLVRMMPVGFGSDAVGLKFSLIDDPNAKRIRRAGMLILGKVSTSELGTMPVTEPEGREPTRNPFNLAYTSGGSSGGSAATVAAGLAPIALGSDGGGSIRIPAALGHLVGPKTSRGTLVATQPVDRELRLSSMGPLARSVEDAAAFMDILSAWPQQFQKHIDLPLSRGLRVKLSTHTKLVETAPEHQAAARRVADILREAGCIVEEGPWMDVAVGEFLMLWQRLMANVPFVSPSKLEPITRWLRETGSLVTKDEAVAKRVELESRIARSFAGADLWVSPTIAMTPPQIGAWRRETPEQSFHSVIGMGAYTAPFNVGGQPAISIPMGISRLGLPIGVQIAGQVGRDLLVLQAARVVERSCGGFLRLAHL